MLYVDTGALLARYLRRDGHHRAAVRAWRLVEERRLRCCTSDFVLDETFTLLARRSSYAFAVERASNILSSAALVILRPGREEELAALDLFRKFADQRVSFTDCVSFVLMRKHGIRRAFSFDRHFTDAGFDRWP